MDASKIFSSIERVAPPKDTRKWHGNCWKWKVIPTNEIVKHEDGTPWQQPMSAYDADRGEFYGVGVVNPNAYFEGRRGVSATYAEAKAAMDARVAEVLAMPDTDGVNPDENATVYRPDSF